MTQIKSGYHYQEHWPEDTPRVDIYSYEMPAHVWKVQTAYRADDLARCGHMMTANGVRIHPEGYVVLSEVDVQRIAKAAAKAAVEAYVARLKEAWDENMIAGEIEEVELKGAELTDGEVERIAHRLKELLQ